MFVEWGRKSFCSRWDSYIYVLLVKRETEILIFIYLYSYYLDFIPHTLEVSVLFDVIILGTPYINRDGLIIIVCLVGSFIGKR